MNIKTTDTLLSSLREESMPPNLHAKIMKRVFIASYGKYLYLSTGILFTNLAVLGTELYRKLSEIEVSSVVSDVAANFSFSPSYLQSAAHSLYKVLPMQSMAATFLTAALCGYMTLVFMRFRRDPQSIGFFRNMVR
jgi:hypothetical protein